MTVFDVLARNMLVALEGGTATAVTASDWASIVAACIGIVFMWWGVRKAVRALMAAFRKGKISV